MTVHPYFRIRKNPASGIHYLSVCSGIEAASQAWEPLGWVPVAFAEIEPFPSAVLAHHWPQVPNLRDMTQWRNWDEDMLASVDVIVGGCPCQAFSVAGLRNSLDDERGNLTLIYVHIIDHIDSIRAARGLAPVVVLYENVPGIYNTKDNAFGCFLGALAGEESALEPAGGKWTNAGYVRGPQRTVAWRTLDVQYFGVAQRRRRVFLVASAGDGFCPAAVLFESEGVRRDSPPSRSTGQGVAENAGDGAAISSGKGWWSDSKIGASLREQDSITKADTLIPTGFCNAGHFVSMRESDISDPLRAKGGDTGNGGETLVAPIWRAGDQANAETLVNLAGTLNNNKGQQGGILFDTAHTLRGEGFDASEDGTGRDTPLVPVIAFHHNAQVDQMRFDPDTSASLTCSQQAAVAFQCKDSGESAIEISPTLRSLNAPNSSDSGGGHIGVAFADTYNGSVSDVAATLGTQSGDGVSSGPSVLLPMAVRRLTPVECARLQGFPDFHARIPWKKKPTEDCPDGPQYKCYGNSMAVPVVVWLGKRIQNNLRP